MKPASGLIGPRMAATAPITCSSQVSSLCWPNYLPVLGAVYDPAAWLQHWECDQACSQSQAHLGCDQLAAFRRSQATPGSFARLPPSGGGGNRQAGSCRR